MRTVSLSTKIKQVSGLIDTTNVDDYTNEFLRDIEDRTKGGLITASLSDKQVAYIDGLWDQHFA